MSILSFLNFKGGCGKTTLSVHVATALSLRGHRVLLVDADPQHSSLDWQVSREIDPLFPVIALPTKTLHKEIQMHAKHYDAIVIDGPPRVDEIARAAIIASDLVLIPVTPSPYDVWAASEIVSLLKEAIIFKPQLKSNFVINRKITGTAIGRDVGDALAEYPVSVLRSTIHQRVAFAESAAQGSTVLELQPTSAAAQEINALTDEVTQ